MAGSVTRSSRIKQLSFSQILRVVLILALILPSSILYFLLINQYKDFMIQTAYTNTGNVIAANNSVLELSLSRLEELSYAARSNRTLFDIFKDTSEYRTSHYLQIDREVRRQMSQIYSYDDLEYNTYLYTERWLYRYEPNEMPDMKHADAHESDLISQAKANNGSVKWISGQSYPSRQNSGAEGNPAGDVLYPITMTLQMKFSYSYNGVLYTVNQNEEAPVLIIHVLESSIRDIYSNSLEYEGQIYGIVNEDNVVISSSSDRLLLGDDFSALREDRVVQNGIDQINLDGEDYLLSYDAVEGRGWLSFSLIPLDSFTRAINVQIRNIYLSTITIFSIIAIVLSVVIARFFGKPIRTLTKAARRVATGDFSANTASSRIYDFQVLTESFNHMELQITELIEENYGMSLREKEARLTALSRQLNPHFLHNTLNIVNLMAIEKDCDEISEMIVNLSEILNFTFKEKSEKIQLKDELLWLSKYVLIMKKRFSSLFEIEVHVDDSIQDALVPKFLLQPFIENSILHGFAGWRSGGFIEISVTDHEDCLNFKIADNGNGMTEAVLNACLEPADRYEGVGVSNIHRRLILVYGESFELTAVSQPSAGTCFIFKLPKEQNNNK